MTSKVLATIARLDRHTAVILAVDINDTMTEFGLESHVLACIHDNATNVNLASRIISGTNERPIGFNINCVAYSLSLSIGDAMK